MKIDFNELKNLNPQNPGSWPWTAKILVFIVTFLAVIILGAVFDWMDRWTEYQTSQGQEEGLKKTFMDRKKDAINLVPVKRQLEETKSNFSALLKQLPDKSEIGALLTDINQAGLGAGLSVDLFRPGAETPTDTFAEQPIALKVSGNYDDLGKFASDIAALPRIVTLSQIEINLNANGLSMDAMAKTYRYLDTAEMAAKKKAATPDDAPPSPPEKEGGA
jgi:type IV pilus assembly protein PilO